MTDGTGELPGWVGDDAARRRCDLELHHRLVGHRIMRVRYFEPDYEGRQEPTWGAANFDAVDYGVELDLDNHTTCSIIWMQHGPNEGLSVSEGPLVPTYLQADAAIAVWDATERWATLGPRSIASITTAWSRWAFGPAINSAGQQVAPAGQSDLCLLTLVLRSPDGRETIVTLGESDSDGRYTYSADNISVFFSVADARNARVLLPGDADVIA